MTAAAASVVERGLPQPRCASNIRFVGPIGGQAEAGRRCWAVPRTGTPGRGRHGSGVQGGRYAAGPAGRAQAAIDRGAGTLAHPAIHREARAASALNHPNICTVYDIGAYDGEPYLVMELLDGQTLDASIVKEPLAINRLLDLGRQIVRGLQAADAAGIVHRYQAREHLRDTSDGPSRAPCSTPTVRAGCVVGEALRLRDDQEKCSACVTPP